MPRRRSSRAAARLRSIGAALRSAGLAITGEVSSELLPLPLDTAGGGVSASKLDEIAGRERAALADGDYRLASEMRDLHSVLAPASAEELQALAPPPLDDVEAQARFFYRFGLR